MGQNGTGRKVAFGVREMDANGFCYYLQLMTTAAPDIASIRKRFWPYVAPNGVSFRAVTSQELRDFVKDHFDKVFSKPNEKRHFSATGERAEALRTMTKLYERGHLEFFLFYDPDGNAVGWHMGEAEDSITFYMRNTGVLPHAQNKGYYRAFASQLEKYIAAIGYERITSQHQATNRRILILKLKDGFDIAGIELTERWGPLVKLVKLLPPDRRESFYAQYGRPEHLP